MRSRAPMRQWCWQCVQTLRFSSSSLSNTIVLHFGHLLQSPSGISRFLDLEVSLDFLTKVVAVFETGGGVTAGSELSSPRVFFVKEVVAMFAARLSFFGPANKPVVCPSSI